MSDSSKKNVVAIKPKMPRNIAVTSNEKAIKDITRIIRIFTTSDAKIRPHFILTGESGSGKSHTIITLAETLGLATLEINAAQLTKEGTSGNSLSKALAPLQHFGSRLVVCFVDEFDKLFISGNTNSALAHETTNGVQNEFLKILEGREASVFGDYGKYNTVPVDKVLFVFAGAFNGEANITIDRLRAFGIKTEFLGRVGLVYGMQRISLADMRQILEGSDLLADYLSLIPSIERTKAIEDIMVAVEENFEHNTIGCRMLSTLTHQYFINGGKFNPQQVQETTFQKTLEIDD